MPSQAGAPSGPLATSQTVTQVFNFTADEVGPDGSVTLRQTFQSVRMESTGPMGKAVVDSTVADAAADPTAQGMRKVLDAMVGESVVIAMAPDGTVRASPAGRVSPTRSRWWRPPIPPRVRPPRPSEAS